VEKLNDAKVHLSDQIAQAVLGARRSSDPALDLGNSVTLVQVSSVTAVLPLGQHIAMYASANGALHGIAQSVSDTFAMRRAASETCRETNGNVTDRLSPSSSDSNSSISISSCEGFANDEPFLRVLSVALGHVHDVGMLAGRFAPPASTTGDEGLREKLEILGVRPVSAHDAVSALVDLYRHNNAAWSTAADTPATHSSSSPPPLRDSVAVIADIDWSKWRAVHGDRVKFIEPATATSPAPAVANAVTDESASRICLCGSGVESGGRDEAQSSRIPDTRTKMDRPGAKEVQNNNLGGGGGNDGDGGVLRGVWACVQEVLGEEEGLEMDVELLETQWEYLGLSSFKQIQLRARLMAAFGRQDLPPNLMFECRTAAAVAAKLTTYSE
jgi:hypothetical protein